jgi:hypothetical protein
MRVRTTVHRSVAVARIILLVIAVLLVVVSVVSAFADRGGRQPPPQPAPDDRNVAPYLAQSKAERFARISAQTAAPPTANQLDYDVTWYDLDIELIPSTDTVAGTVTVTAEVVAASISTLELDLENTGMTVTACRSGGFAAAFSHSGDILTVTLDQSYTTGEMVTVEVDYSGTPDASYGAFGFDTYNGADMIWSLSEPFGARSWWPCKDHPEDKADSVDVRVTVPDNLIVASNGLLVAQTPVSGSRTRFHWHEGYPITTYLVAVTAHPYTVYSDWYVPSPADSMEIQFFVFPDHYPLVQANYAKTKDMLAVFASLYGEYPFLEEKYGHAEFLWGGGMEHQTCTSLGTWNEWVIAHEAAHMWWGDYVTCNDFHHIWMNEGFASYSEALWDENAYGMESYFNEMQASKYLGPGTVYVPDTSDWNRIFSSNLSYNKASWVLHMLRHVVGDATFFDILSAYYHDPARAYGTVTTEQFRDICEAVWGGDLDWFFHQWIYEEYYPDYSYGWSASAAGPVWHIDLDITQRQTNTIYKMPVDVVVEFAGGDTTLVVWDSLAVQSFNLTVDQEPVAVALDPDEWILRTVEKQIADPTFHRGVLVVNGVHFDTYGAEITAAYVDSTFSGSYPFTFWDCFTTPPTGGYPAELPAPIGTGPIPADTLKQFSTVVWVGNNYVGDISAWQETPILSYLESGGNLLLMSRMGVDFLSAPLLDYLGITWAESNYNTIGNCIAGYPGLGNMSFLATQSYCSVFDTTLSQPESELLFTDTAAFAQPRGLGVWRRPAGGGAHRTDGAQFAFISGRAYRYNRAALEANVEFILMNLFEEPIVPTAVEDDTPTPRFALEQNVPNPFNPHTTIRFTLPARTDATLRVYDVTGRLVSEIATGALDAGTHTLRWDGTDRRGHRVASGVYFYRLRAGTHTATRKMVLLR